jgi:hypothetical protein
MKIRWLITSTHRKVEKWVIENWHTPQSQWFIMSFPIKNAIQLEANPSLVGENHGRSFAPCRLQESCGAEISARRHPWASREHHGVPAAPVAHTVGTHTFLCEFSQILSYFSAESQVSPRFADQIPTLWQFHTLLWKITILITFNNYRYIIELKGPWFRLHYGRVYRHSIPLDQHCCWPKPLILDPWNHHNLLDISH